MSLDPFDYREPACALCGGEEFYYPEKAKKSSVALSGMMAKLDAALNREDYSEAKRLLLFWVEETQSAGDQKGELSVQNELIGLYRKLYAAQSALAAAQRSIELVAQLGLGDSVSGATILLNAATNLKAFGQTAAAMEHYEQVQQTYTRLLPENDPLLGAFYNNYALALADIGNVAQAMDCFEKALDIMKLCENGALEMAVTYLNMADLYDMSNPENEQTITALLESALTCLDSPELPRNGYYAFTCRKCAPVFDYYGYFQTKIDLNKRADDIYAGN